MNNESFNLKVKDIEQEVNNLKISRELGLGLINYYYATTTLAIPARQFGNAIRITVTAKDFEQYPFMCMLTSDRPDKVAQTMIDSCTWSGRSVTYVFYTTEESAMTVKFGAHTTANCTITAEVANEQLV